MTTTPGDTRIMPLFSRRRRVASVVMGVVLGVVGVLVVLLMAALMAFGSSTDRLGPELAAVVVGLVVAFEGVWIVARSTRLRATLTGTVLTVTGAFGTRSADLAAVDGARVTTYTARVGTSWTLKLTGGGDLRRLGIFADAKLRPGAFVSPDAADMAAMADALERNPNRTAVASAIEGLDHCTGLAGGAPRHHRRAAKAQPAGVFGQAPARRRRVPAETPDPADGPAGT